MPLLTSSVHVDQALTNVSIAYAQEQSRFVADKLFPIISTQKLTDKYFVFDKGNYLRSVAGVRAPGSETFGANYTLSTDSFSCTENGVHMDLDDLIVANADAGLNIEISTTQYITEQLLLKREKDFAAAAFTNGVSGSVRLRYLGEAPLVEDNTVRADDSLLVNAGVGG